MKNKLLILAIIMSGFVYGCADTWNKADFRGGLFCSSKSDYIIISQSGGLIMDVWKLRDTFVSSPKDSDGWIFKTPTGSVAIGGDAKVIRVAKNSNTWNSYQEYHMEFETMTYRDKYNKEK